MRTKLASENVVEPKTITDGIFLSDKDKEWLRNMDEDTKTFLQTITSQEENMIHAKRKCQAADTAIRAIAIAHLGCNSLNDGMCNVNAPHKRRRTKSFG